MRRALLLAPRRFNSNCTDSISSTGALLTAVKINGMINLFREKGHCVAKIDPLGRPRWKAVEAPELAPEADGRILANIVPSPTRLSLQDKVFVGNELPGGQEWWAAGEVVKFLRTMYCGSTGAEYMHMPDASHKQWFRERFERTCDAGLPDLRPYPTRSAAERLRSFELLLQSDRFEHALASRFPAAKRFGLEGCEALMPGIHALIGRAAELGLTAVEMGTSHRGRLNLLHGLLDKHFGIICMEFADDGKNPHVGDVRYHLGTTAELTMPESGRRVHLSLSPNPSHLEAVNPVVMGSARAKQVRLGGGGDSAEVDQLAKRRVMPILLHGDAAFAGQGLVAETMQLSGLDDYSVGGTVHIVLNNQIGFTTNPENSRSTRYATDVGKAAGVPILHVNADDVEAVVRAFELAAEWRQYSCRDIILDLVGYRRFGHNEQDDASYTQPGLHRSVCQHPTVAALYGAQLQADAVLAAGDAEALTTAIDEKLEAHRLAPPSEAPEDWMASDWSERTWHQMQQPNPTGLPFETLQAVGRTISQLPEGFSAHPGVEKLMAARRDAIVKGEGINWAFGEALAFGSLLTDFHPEGAEPALQYKPHRSVWVRLSGQDSKRGTFGHRHAVVYDQDTEEPFCSLNAIPGNARFDVCNSSLSEAAVLGFEYGYSLAVQDEALTVWEAQFGDFANNAQVMIDNFIASGEAKWGCASALVLLLPHGYDGQGPEHSSARLERFLQLVDGDPDQVRVRAPNLQVAQPSTPAQYFHLLRRQIHSPHLKPLVLAAPKWLLHHRPCTSSLRDFGPNTSFAPLIVDGAEEDNLRDQDAFLWGGKAAVQALREGWRCPGGDHPDPNRHRLASGGINGDWCAEAREKVERIALCNPNVYYKLAHARRSRKDGRLALARLEQIAPFPYEAIAKLAAAYPNAEITWVQEAPKNMGPWSFLQARFRTAVRAYGLEQQGFGGRSELDSNDLVDGPGDASKSAQGPRLLPALHYIGRPAAASTATGSFRVHMAEQKALINAVFETPKRDRHQTRRPTLDDDEEELEGENFGYAFVPFS